MGKSFFIDFTQLNHMDFPVGTNVVIYNYHAKRALFLHKTSEVHFDIIQLVNKRSRKIYIRETDVTLLCRDDGKLELAELPDIFCVTPNPRRLNVGSRQSGLVG